MRPPALIAVLSLVAAACGGAATTPALPEPPAVLPLSSPAPEPLPVLSVEPEGAGTRVVRARTDAFDVYEQPGPGAVLVQRISPVNAWRQPLALPVLSAFRDVESTRWLKVRLPDANGSTGWLRGQGVATSRVQHRIVVDLSDRVLRHFREDRLVHEIPVGIGAEQTPSTPGRYFVWALVDYADDTGPYGAFALGLSGFSEVLTDWPGGGRMAIHGTTDPSDPGRAVSHGCIRVLNAELAGLTRVPMGSPVTIRP